MTPARPPVRRLSSNPPGQPGQPVQPGKRRLVQALTAGAACCLSPSLLWAQPPAAAWPSRPLRLVVGYPPGASPDVQARLLAEPLAQALGQPVVVENRPGAGGNVGAALIAQASDGHTLGVIGNGPLTSAPFLYRQLPYDPAKDFAALALIGSAPLVWVSTDPQAASDPARYIQRLRAAGSPLAYGSVGAGSGGHLGMELLKQALNIRELLHVPFNGGPAVLNAMAGGHVHMSVLPLSTVLPLLQAGKLHAVATTTAQRSALAPQLPSLQDIGVRGIHIEVFNAVVAPARLPLAAQQRLGQALHGILSARQIRQKLLAQGWRVADPSAQALRARIQHDTAMYRGVITRNGIRLD